MSQMTVFNLTKASDRFASHHFPRNHWKLNIIQLLSSSKFQKV
jgi:hypothetical protein